MSGTKKVVGGKQDGAGRPVGRPKGTAKTGGKPLSRRCRNCNKLRSEWPAGRSHSAEYCSDACEQSRFDGKRVELPCGYCGRMISAPSSKVSMNGAIYCNRAGYLSALHGKAMSGACETLGQRLRYVGEVEE